MTFNILGFTGSRADYFLQRPLFLCLAKHPLISFSLIVSGGILTEENFNTLEAIRSDGFDICGLVDLEDTIEDTHLKSISLLLSRLPEYINSFKPDLCIVYADRYESFAFALASFHLDKVLLHVEAGDLTYGGTFDDSIRHSISTISHLYSTTTENSFRILQSFGISSERIHLTGLLSYDNLNDLDLIDPVDILSDLNLDPCLPLILATYHPIPRNPSLTINESSNFFAALRTLSKTANVLVTSPNHDGGRIPILAHIEESIKDNTIVYVESLGANRYYSLMSHSRNVPVTVTGNSSSIVKEAPFFNAHSLNIGVRQEGRLSSPTQVNVLAIQNIIEDALHRLCMTPCMKVDNPYLQESPSLRLAEFILRMLTTYSHSKLISNNLNFAKQHNASSLYA